ncbi:dihydrodipicolinate synthetase [Mesorhizobium sp. Root554]|uniref:dihydrodipicolinate synthase family protein n=1 Tax=unclassified Mesorhizobium TaxID=325217 RepID=UPI0006F92D7B|nr:MULTISPECIES: dihydrodipicolinate synthase family protein [unclassified Mesorhizobium]KQZ13449.1 dihydrodipicolinate synthetase [Mesorhizobium sp. Root1471]KQZ35961.1 dihydrodipicolinate synthetase [Mesorhizobium sp. Root554]
MSKFAVSGVFSAAATPLNADLSVDHARFATHCRRLLDAGCHGVALLGTTGEANSFSVAERKEILEKVIAAGIDPDALMPGTGVAAIPETVDLTRHALSAGVRKVVMLPPFYYKGVSDDGLFAAYARTLDAIADDRLRVVLYHIPQVSGIPLSVDLVSRLVTAYPDTVVGVKESKGDFANMQALIKACPNLAVFPGADPLMLPLLKEGGAGCITATSNLIADSLRTVFDGYADPSAVAQVEAAQARIDAWRTLSNSYAQIPTIKAMIGIENGETGWERLRPPLMPLSPSEIADLAPRIASLP